MKSLVRLSAVLGIVASTLIGPSIKGIPALALSAEEVLQKLTPVPVFTITDQNGSPLVASVKKEGNENSSVAGVFISKSDADAFVEKLKGENPDLAATVKVVPVSLGEVYEMSQSSQKSGQKLQFAYVPIRRQVESAKTGMFYANVLLASIQCPCPCIEFIVGRERQKRGRADLKSGVFYSHCSFGHDGPASAYPCRNTSSIQHRLEGHPKLNFAFIHLLVAREIPPPITYHNWVGRVWLWLF